MHGHKLDEAKLDWSLLPWRAVGEVVRVLDYGARKYARDDWQHVALGNRRYFAAAIRHLLAWHAGEKLDSESGLPHLAHAACCILFLLQFEVMGWIWSARELPTENASSVEGPHQAGCILMEGNGYAEPAVLYAERSGSER